jgi:hypothetical protein
MPEMPAPVEISVPAEGNFVQAINARFRRDVKMHEAFEAGVLVHQLDGFEDQAKRWSPCAEDSRSGNCQGSRTRARRSRVSASMIFAGLQSRDGRIPTFSLDGGVILRPSTIHAFCGYGIDGSIDDNKPLSCNHIDPSTCVPGCGDPPRWCNKANPHDEGAWLTCGLGWGSNGVRPWRQQDFGGAGGLFDLFEQSGANFEGVGSFSGYNEIVVDADNWIGLLPHSVEGIFMIECDDNDVNLRYGAADGGGTAMNCRDARANAIDLHRKFIQEYELSESDFPLLTLRPGNWEEPFAAPLGSHPRAATDGIPAALSSSPSQATAESQQGTPRFGRPDVHCETCESHHANGNGLTSAKCDAMIRNRQGKFWSMWDVAAWLKRAPGRAACFEEGWQHFEFDAALKGERCDRNWLDGVMERPEFKSPAPALLGFDETIYAYCSAVNKQPEGPFYQDNAGLASRCVQANQNVLRVFANWNMCTNLQWQTCAMKGLLPGQDRRMMQFSIAPKDLDAGLFESPEYCVGDCSYNYAISDVYFAEVCVTSHVCKNREELFNLEVGTLFECEFDEHAFLELRELLKG